MLSIPSSLMKTEDIRTEPSVCLEKRKKSLWSNLTLIDPPTFACVGERDGIANWRTMERRLDAMSNLGIPTEFHHYPGLSHGFGLGSGTVAEGWLDEAVSFWEAQI